MLFGSLALEVSIGLVLMLLLVSLILTAVVESIESLLKTRAAHLERAIAELLQDRKGDGLRKKFYEHPLIAALYPGEYAATSFDENGRIESRDRNRARRLPTYIPREQFSLALLDLARSGSLDGSGDGRVARAISAAAAVSGSGGLQTDRPRFSETLIALPASELGRLRNELEAWYDGAMDRASGWYRRRTQLVLFILGLLVAVLLNVNAVVVGQTLATAPALASAVADLAEDALRKAQEGAGTGGQQDMAAPAGADGGDSVASAGGEGEARAVEGVLPGEAEARDRPPGQGPATTGNTAAIVPPEAAVPENGEREAARLAREIQSGVLALGLPIGWGEGTRARMAVLYSGGGLSVAAQSFLLLAGYLITAFAATIGAPFWFDLLNKLIVIRSTVKPREKSRDEGSEDR